MENSALIFENMYTKSDALKEAKDLTKNLVGGDFERQYGKMEKSNDRRKCVLVGVSLGVLAVWLLVITIIREVQINRLRSEVDQLTVNMIANSANIMALNQKLSNNRLFNEFKNLEDTIYTDEDQDGNLVEDITVADRVVIDKAKETNKEKSSDPSLNKLHGLTVLEDETQVDADDEDMYDGDEDAESGDWYPDYYKQGPKIGTTNMVHLKPEDFTDTVVAVEKVKHVPIPNIKEIKRLLNENPEIPDIEIPTMPVPTKTSDELSRVKRSVFPDTPAEAVDELAVSKAYSKAEDRRKTKKFSSSTDPSLIGKMALHTFTRTVRNSDGEENAHRRPFIAAHFYGNTSHLNMASHKHFKGNGLVRVAHDSPHNVWYPSPWTVASPHPKPTLTHTGHVRVHHSGVYLVYVQIYYLDIKDRVSWVLHRTNAEIEGRETLLQCAQFSQAVAEDPPIEKPNSCFSAAALFLRAGDRLAVRNTGGDIHSLMEPEKSFIGLIKLADAQDPDEDF